MTRVAVIGAGPGGLCMAIHLKQAGIEDFVVLEKADGVGGTWRHNRYPGAACDVQSHLYSYSFRPKVDWSRPYGTQPEILAYFEECVDEYGLAPHIRLSCGVESARWDGGHWHLTTEQGDDVVARTLVASVGMFNDVNWPDVPGLDAFGGTVFHSARWKDGHDLTGEAVAVIGSAASAVQLVPEVAKLAGKLHVFQRTATWVLPKEDTPYTPEQIAAFRADPGIVAADREAIFRRVDKAITFSDPEMLRLSEAAGLRNLEVVEDPEVRRKLTPQIPYGCHRPLVSNDYYPTFNRPNVELVTDPIAKVTGSSIVTADGTERPVDTIILATGFKTTQYTAAIPITGRDGVRLDEAWSAGAQAYLGISTSGFPNLFMLYGPNTNNGSILFMIECQVAYVMRQLRRMEEEGLAWMDVRRDVMDRYNEELQRDLDRVEVWQAGCSGYYRAPSGRIVTQWPHTMTEYQRRTERPDPDAYQVA